MPAQDRNCWQTILWGRETVSPIPGFPGGLLAVGTVGCVLPGLPRLMLSAPIARTTLRFTSATLTLSIT